MEEEETDRLDVCQKSRWSVCGGSLEGRMARDR